MPVDGERRPCTNTEKLDCVGEMTYTDLSAASGGGVGSTDADGQDTPEQRPPQGGWRCDTCAYWEAEAQE